MVHTNDSRVLLFHRLFRLFGFDCDCCHFLVGSGLSLLNLFGLYICFNFHACVLGLQIFKSGLKYDQLKIPFLAKTLLHTPFTQQVCVVDRSRLSYVSTYFVPHLMTLIILLL